MKTNTTSKTPIDVYQIITDRLISILEAGTAPWRKPWNGQDGGPLNLHSKKHYRGINHFLLACSPYASPFWLTFKQAQDHGGNVRRDEKGMPVIFWKIYEKEDAQAEDGKKTLPVLRSTLNKLKASPRPYLRTSRSTSTIRLRQPRQ